MKAKGQKAAVCREKISVKTNTLLKEFTPSFNNQKKEKYNRECIFCHRFQNGLIRISQWEFDTKRKKQILIEKLPISIQTSPDYYQYEEDAEDCQSFWVEFSCSELFEDCENDYFFQSDIMVLQHPLLLSCKKYIQTLDKSLFTITASEMGICGIQPTPYIFQNVPRWIKSKEGSSDKFEIITRGAKSCIISMKAPSGGGIYSRDQIDYLLKTVLTAFGAALKSAAEIKKKDLYHTHRKLGLRQLRKQQGTYIPCSDDWCQCKWGKRNCFSCSRPGRF